MVSPHPNNDIQIKKISTLTLFQAFFEKSLQPVYKSEHNNTEICKNENEIFPSILRTITRICISSGF